jgi:hypothetical protein
MVMNFDQNIDHLFFAAEMIHVVSVKDTNVQLYEQAGIEFRSELDVQHREVHVGRVAISCTLVVEQVVQVLRSEYALQVRVSVVF